jgi:hypothetical protein
MAKVIIDEKEYDTDDLTDEAKAQLASFQFVENELARLNAQAAAIQTARIAYARALKEALGEEPEDDIEVDGDDIDLDLD